MFRRILGFLLKKIFFKPVRVNYSAQTLYKTMQSCLIMYRVTQDEIWVLRAREVGKLITKYQLKNGGIDVRYNYNFGNRLIHRKGQALSCEVTALSALMEYKELTSSSLFDRAIEKGFNWIRENSFEIAKGKNSIPYCPEVSKETCILNGVSFVSSAVGLFSAFKGDREFQELYLGYIVFLSSKLEFNSKGGYWPYFDIESQNLGNELIEKIDYYHLAQQLEAHSIAELKNPNSVQKEMILMVANYLVNLQNDFGIIPYDNKGFFAGNIHSWGLASVIPAMIRASEIHPQKSNDYLKVANFVAEWLLEYAWNGEYFYDILSPSGEVITNRYMVRSDAWCLHAFSSYYSLTQDLRFGKVVELCFDRIEDRNYSGDESHAVGSVQLFLERFQRRV